MGEPVRLSSGTATSTNPIRRSQHLQHAGHSSSNNSIRENAPVRGGIIRQSGTFSGGNSVATEDSYDLAHHDCLGSDARHSSDYPHSQVSDHSNSRSTSGKWVLMAFLGIVLLTGCACVCFGLYKFYLDPAQNAVWPAFVVAMGGILTIAVFCPVTIILGGRWRDARLQGDVFLRQEKDVLVYVGLSLVVAAGIMLGLTGMYYWATPKVGQNRRSFGGYLIALGLIYEGLIIPPLLFVFHPIIRQYFKSSSNDQGSSAENGSATGATNDGGVHRSQSSQSSSSRVAQIPAPAIPERLPPLFGDGGGNNNGNGAISHRPKSLSGSSNSSPFGRSLAAEQALEQLSQTHSQLPIKWTKSKTFLGKGAFGFVTLGMTDSGQLVAIKEVAFHTNELNEVEAVANEIGLMKSLVHPNIVQYLCAEVNASDQNLTLNIVMEYMPGGSIATLLQKFGPFPESVVRAYTRQVILGLEYLHNFNVIHRDIKGGNILINNEGVAKLADFGASKAVADLCQKGSGKSAQLQTFCGTPWWAAPEVIKNDGYGRKADIWSVGATVIEMATGEPPFFSYNSMGAILQIGNLQRGLDPPETMSEDGQNFLAVIMQCNPAARPTSSRLLLHPYLDPDEVFAESIPNMHALEMPDYRSKAGQPAGVAMRKQDPRLAADVMRSTIVSSEEQSSSTKGRSENSKRSSPRNAFPSNSALAELEAHAPGLAEAILQLRLAQPDHRASLGPRYGQENSSGRHTSAGSRTNTTNANRSDANPLSIRSSFSSKVSTTGWVASDDISPELAPTLSAASTAGGLEYMHRRAQSSGTGTNNGGTSGTSPDDRTTLKAGAVGGKLPELNMPPPSPSGRRLSGLSPSPLPRLSPS